MTIFTFRGGYMKYNEFKEAKSHGTADFPVEYYHVSPGASNYIMQLHWHEELEIVRVLRGKLLLFVNNEQRQLEPCDIAFIGSGMLHRAEPIDSTYECLVFSPSFLKKHSTGRLSELLTPLISGDSTIAPMEREDDDISALIDEIFTSFSEKDAFLELKISSCIAKLFYILYRSGRIVTGGNGSTTKHQARTMIKLISWIDEHYTEHISLDDMAMLCNLSPKYLCGFFKRMTGFTPTEYINRLRIEKACLALSDGHTSITDAAFDNGFNELSYFSKLFKKYVGCSPREYKAK